MKKQETQADQIRRYVRQNGSITTMEAFFELGITKLATRISEMKRNGIAIVGETEYSKNRYGQTVHYKRYRRA